MSAASTPTGRRQDKTMSSRLMTMKFMQRAAASSSATASSIHSAPASSPLPASYHHDSNGHPSVKRQKLSPSTPQFNDATASTPLAAYQSRGPPIPFSHEGSIVRGPQIYGENAAETPWELHTPSDQGASYELPTPSSSAMMRESSPPDSPLNGRRTFGNFKRKQQQSTTNESSAVSCTNNDGDGDGLLSSGAEDEDYEAHNSMMRGRKSPFQKGGNKDFKARRLREGAQSHQRNNDRLDTLDLRKLKSGGISAASGMRNTASTRGKKYKVDKGKNTR